MSSILFSLPELYESYKNWISSHPQLASDFETTAKWISYFIAGRVNNSTIVSELVYCLSNLLVLFNDRIICKTQKLEIPKSGDKLKLWLTILDYSEVFLELSAKKLWGHSGKWAIIVILQMFKCISRLLLIYSHKEIIIENPPIPVLKRKKIESNYSTDFSMEEARSQLDSVSFVLKRSGKVIRKVDASPPVNIRNWKPINLENNTNNEYKENIVEKSLKGKQLIAETLYIIKPLAHLGSVYCFGNNTWKPWILSFLMDIGSLQLYQSQQHINNSLTKTQKLQISRRYLALVLYLLRSPFYEKHSKDRVQAFLYTLSKKIPLAAMICTPLAQYIPNWQKTYFYMWST